MDREVVLLQQLRGGLTNWLDIIRRATGLKLVRIEGTPAEGLSIIGSSYPPRASLEFRKTFPPRVLFGRTFDGPPAGRQLVKRPCECAREFIREVLEKRGILS